MQRVAPYIKCERRYSKKKKVDSIFSTNYMLDVSNCECLLPLLKQLFFRFHWKASLHGFVGRNWTWQGCPNTAFLRVQIVYGLSQHFTSQGLKRAFGSPLSFLPCGIKQSPFCMPLTRTHIDLQLSFAFGVCMKRLQRCSSHPWPPACFLFCRHGLKTRTTCLSKQNQASSSYRDSVKWTHCAKPFFFFFQCLGHACRSCSR